MSEYHTNKHGFRGVTHTNAGYSTDLVHVHNAEQRALPYVPQQGLPAARRAEHRAEQRALTQRTLART
jgi:hypothetical protein